jgi:hypothetical protein
VGHDRLAEIANLGKHKYYLRVWYWAGDAGSYQLTSRFTAADLPSDAEPNDDIDHAQPLLLNSSCTGRLNYLKYDAGDEGVYDRVDWYKVVTTESGKLTVQGVAKNTLRFNNFQLYDGDKVTRLNYGSWGAEALTSVSNLLPGTYYIYVPHYDGYGSYTLTTTFTKAALIDDTEPNDTQDKAQAILLADTVYARIGYTNAGYTDKVDWYRFSIPEDGNVRIRFLAEPTLQLNNPSLCTENNVNRKGSPQWGSDFLFAIDGLAKGEYWLCVPQYSGYGAYRFIVNVEPYRYANDREPNNSFKQAVKIESGQTLTGHLGQYRVDWDEEWKTGMPLPCRPMEKLLLIF